MKTIPRFKPVMVSPDKMKLIAAKLAESLGYNFDDIIGTRRPAALVFARHSIMFICRETLGATCASVGLLLNRHHSDVVYACRVLNVQAEVYPDIGARITKLKTIASEFLEAGL
jgi:chromosomal replication initiation ATPase DnaA